ncbi:pyridoxine 5'-phosphate synthase [Flavobacteriaceae bacterium]|jgi:pyridoxine 5-phosphate synthase|nr:pyridoxine 5'-phosphate synthase [Flavobacteriaceae bacterium]MBT4297228.1 pyridoxine 5'-phosphate synthase [Flavobacteriaceae bacterium]MBT5232390.1 pyridoxine 5'-phosphate synthase [Flavobacteriaceae bacterium]MBT5493985.1 pyridoxine 5'-phosphate synthase [Flavobacteriaceae bacterium]MBT6654348.1 pyridoxine 5'-phosphate synthase [Flavobacteriaceae bacterium]|tara:strand:+ start:26 stop:754 length:729 start_codon:yes stop_codon:yes gene_type:complete
MTKLSVNINKIATIRNARGGSNPNLLKMAKDIQSYGAQGITIHPRPDQRHITYKDAIDLPKIISTEFNIEGNPNEKFIELVCKIKPDQVTLVPDSVDAITSNSGWDTLKNKSFLKEVVSEFKNNGIRTSIFIDTELKLIEGAKNTGADRIELYTESFAVNYLKGNKDEINKYINASILANDLGMGVNAGHDLSLENIHFFVDKIPYLDEVSIGHAIICESLYLGIENVVNMYLQKINNASKK